MEMMVEYIMKITHRVGCEITFSQASDADREYFGGIVLEILTVCHHIQGYVGVDDDFHKYRSAILSAL